MKWLQQLSHAIDYIEDNLENEISYDEAAKLACCSTYYFQRMFSYISGISLSEYIRRRRMTVAAFELQTSDKKILDIGMKYGYKSPTAFNRAFQNIHSVAPTAARVEGTTLNAYPRISFSITVTGGTNMRYRIEQKDSIRVVGVKTPLKENAEYNFKVVPGFWDKVLESPLYYDICKLSNLDNPNILGISSYTNPKNIYYYIAVSTDKPLPNNMFELKIPAATWVIFEGSSHFQESVQTIFKRFLTEWLPFSGYEYANLPDIEVYPISNQNSKSSHVEVWIAVKKQNNNKIEEE
ncbi:AraC family transcriptional regulator [Clostridium tetani]|uniref:AraC family transcriptional regulator n=1 Tax=Clostridium tetani TaxID=1513 RepID=A0A4Q0VFY7_CLOTA|nr:AraC family transcriptional regulator [Clostridium tetani]RXI49965.1 AraC family transcriptional regulator [Clostridium tetani]BDR67679.1 AraC family transcriptional regulator [Clostridium tetani]BDR73071.1 AraC family transcriptional regulator [Clostridium tetani]BDR81612.1 AraC family transcriptional regulator [Clostridium tetani]BDR89994.1 AraC family transcriptional regulator [Clostridium tetani]